MIRSKITSQRKASILRVAKTLIGKQFDLDEDFAQALDYSHDVAIGVLGALRRGGHILYDSWRGPTGKWCFRMVAVFTDAVDEQPSLFGGLL